MPSSSGSCIFAQSIGECVILFVIKSQYLVECVWDIVHHQIQIFVICLFFLGEEIMMHFYAVRVREFFDYFKFSVGVFWVLIDLFNSYFFVVLFSDGFVDNSESSLSYYFLP